MIRLSRPKEPDFFSSEEVISEINRMNTFYNQELKLRDEIKFKPQYHLNNQIKDLLIKAFNNKCAFCETPFINRKNVVVERFRPSIKAMNLKGIISEEHYWWLRYEWSNLYPICRECNKSKGNLFPVGGKRAIPNVRGNELQKENPLLLDPCFDQPEKHFLFDLSSGLMISDTKRGRLTIDIYGLNRKELLKQRKYEILNINNRLSELLDILRKMSRKLITNVDMTYLKEIELSLLELFKDSSQPFLLVKRQSIISILIENLHLFDKLYFKIQWKKIIDSHPIIPFGEQQKTALTKYNDYLIKGNTYDLNKKSKLDLYFRKSLYIERVEIKNFKTIRYMEINIQSSLEESAPWTLMLGENSTGKSSILKAIALTLMGNSSRKKIEGLDAKRFLYHRSKSGYVKVFLTGRQDPIELFFNHQDTEFKGNIEDAPVLLMGYGSTRLLSKSSELNAIKKDIDAIRCENLFNPYFSLVDAELWLSQLTNKKFKDATQTIKRLFAINGNYRFIRRFNKSTGKREIYITLFGSKSTLDELSDGYQSIVALACDIMMVLQEIWQDSEYAQGIVLLDELDVHLHPRWKMQIINKLKETFPGIQFISTSHEPLVLRGLKSEEILVLKRDKHHRLYTLENLPSPVGLRVDQILTSSYFGLNSTIDPEVEKLFDRYYLLLTESYLSSEEQNELNDIEMELESIKLLGDTPRDQLMYKAIDNFLAREKDTIRRGEVNSLKEETVQRVVDIMTSLEYEGEY